MNFKIVNKKKFFKMLFLVLSIVIIFLFIFFNKTYSKTEIKYKEEYVCAGDTLWSIIEEQYNTNLYLKGRDIRDIIKEIKDINNITNENLEIGQKILIPTI